MALSNAKWKRGGQKHVVLRKAKIEVFRGKDGLYYFHVKAANGEIVSTSEGYTRRFTANQGAKRAVSLAAAIGRAELRKADNNRRRAQRNKAAVSKTKARRAS